MYPIKNTLKGAALDDSFTNERHNNNNFNNK